MLSVEGEERVTGDPGCFLQSLGSCQGSPGETSVCPEDMEGFGNHA